MSNNPASNSQPEAIAPVMADTHVGASRQRVWRYVILPIIGVAAVAILALRVDVGGIVDELRGAELPWVLASAAALTIFYLVRAARWYLILGRRHPYTLVFWISSVGYLANNAAPGLGEVAKPWLLRRRRNVPFASGMSTVMLERLLDFWGLATLGLFSFVVLAVQGSSVPGWLLGVGAGVAGATTLILIATFIAARNTDSVVAWLRRVLNRLPLSTRLADRVCDVIDSLLVGAAIMRSSPATQAALFGSTWATWLINALAAYFAFRAIGLDPEPAVLVGGLMAVAVSQGLPAPPGYIGTYQAVWLLAYAALGLGPEQKVLAAAIVSHGLILILTVTYGFLGLHSVLVSARELLSLKKEPRQAFAPAGLTSEEEP